MAHEPLKRTYWNGVECPTMAQHRHLRIATTSASNTEVHVPKLARCITAGQYSYLSYLELAESLAS